MKSWLIALPIFAAALIASPQVRGSDDNTRQPFSKLPLVFEPNRGQAADGQFLTRAGGMIMLLSPDRIRVTVPHAGSAEHPDSPRLLTIELRRAEANVLGEGLELQPGKSNYYVGNRKSTWLSGIPQYGKVGFKGIYPGIDVIYYGNCGRLEDDFVLQPNIDTRSLRLKFSGADELTLSEEGDLVIRVGTQRLLLHRPEAYQQDGGKRTAVNSTYALLDPNEAEILIGKYDPNRPLIVDPVLSYSTLIGANNSTTVQGVAVDASGNVLITGETYATNYPTVAAFQATNAGYTDLFVTKLNPAGDQILYSTYLGGSSFDNAAGIAVDGSGNAYVAGTVTSSDFPTTPGAFMTTCGTFCNTPTITKIGPDGTLVFSTYMGGSNSPAHAIAVDGAGEAYIAGDTASNDLPTTPGSFDPIYQGSICTSCFNAYVEKLNASGSALVYSTYFGLPAFGNVPATDGTGIAIDQTGSAYLVGNTTAIPLLNPIQSSIVGGPNAFITKFSPDGSSLVFSTYLGGTSPYFFEEAGDFATGVAVDASGDAHVVGTSSSCEFPLTLNAVSTDCVTTSYDQKVFALVLNSAGNQLLFATFVRSGFSSGIAVDAKGNSYITGTTTAQDLPVLNPIESTSNRSTSTGFVSELDSTGKLLFSTYLAATSGGSQPAGIAVDSKGGIYVAGAAQGDFPLVRPIPSQILQTTFFTLFVAKISPQKTAQISLSPRVSPTLALRNVSSTPVTINSIVPSTNFTQGGNCGTSLAAGANCTLIEEGAKDHKTKGTVTVTANNVAQTFTISKSALGDSVGSLISSFPLYLSFPSQYLGSSSSVQQVIVQNPGLQAGAINSITIGSGPFSQTNDCPPLLNPGTFCTISVTYTAATTQDFSNMAIVHDPGMTTDTVYLNGIGSTTAISASTPMVEFGNQYLNQPLLGRMVNLTNTTPYPATITSLAVSTGFLETDTCKKALQPHASCRVSVSYQPSTNQNAAGTLTANNYGPGGPEVVSLTATGLISAALSVSPISIDFPQAVVNVKNGPQTVNLTNTSSAAVPVTSIQLGAPFSETDNCIGTLAVGASCQISVYVTPTQLGMVAATMSISFTGSGSPQLVGLTGTVVTLLDFLPSPVVFGQQQVGMPSPSMSLSVNNSTSQQITLKSFTVQGSEFAIADNFCPTILKPFTGCGLDLVFTPNATGARTGTLSISASDYSQPHVISLQGTGIGAGELSLSVTSLDFGTVKVGMISTAQQITLTNIGTGTINLSSITGSPSFFPVTNACGSSLAVGSSCNVSVQFGPTLQGLVSGTLTINDDAVGNPHLVSLTGIGQ